MVQVDDDVVQVLTEAEAWDFLRRQEVGRLAYHVGGEVFIVPVNYAVSGPRQVVFRTSQGSKLFGVTVGKTVALEADTYDDREATSVVVRGLAHHLHGDEADAADALPLRAWVPTEKDEWVAVSVTETSGRHFRLDRGPAATAER